MLTEIFITEEIIKEAPICTAKDCAISRAIKNVVKRGTEVATGTSAIMLSREGDIVWLKMPTVVSEFRYLFDTCFPVEPLKFQLNIPKKFLQVENAYQS